MTERNNEDRFAPPPMGQQGFTPQMPNQQQNNQVQFVVPTEIVDLPSQGRFYPEGHTLHNKKTVEIRYMTAKEEDILTSSTLIKKGIVFDRLLQSLMVENIHADDLLVGDKSALLVAARITGYGPEYDTNVTCPSCRTKTQYSFDLVESIPKYEDDTEYSALFPVTQTERGTYIINLEKIDSLVEVKFLNGHDEKRLTSITNAKKKNNLGESPITDALKACIVSVNDNPDRGYVNGFVDNMPALQARKLRNIYKKISPKTNLTSLFSCASCAYEQELEVPINVNFFWPDA